MHVQMCRRDFGRTTPGWHPHVESTAHDGDFQRGGAPMLAPLYGPAGLVGPVGATDHPYQGMDPSDPVTHVRPYNPQPGMIGWLNFDGAVPNDSQAISGSKRLKGRVRR